MSAIEQIKSRLEKQNENNTILDLSEIPIHNITEEIKKLLQRFKKVKVLMLRHCDLESLENLPKWKLTAIDLSENRFKDNIIDKLVTIPTFTQILLMENSLESLDNLKRLSVLKFLQEVDFADNPVAAQPNYRPILFDSIKSLELVDQRDLNGEFPVEEQEEDEVSQFDEDEDADQQEEQYQEDSHDESGGKAKKPYQRK